MDTTFIFGIINNISLLLALGFLYAVCIRRWDASTTRGQLILGLLFGLVAVIGMLFPLQYAPGLFFDGRSILLGTIGFFGGGIAAAVAATMTAALRLWQGGPGMAMGLGTILATAGIGTLFHRLRPRHPGVTRLPALFGFGLLLHAAMLACTLLLPPELRFRVLESLLLPLLTIYPMATMLYGRLMLELEERKQSRARLTAEVEERTQELSALNQELTAQNEELTAMQEELSAQNEEMTAMNEEISALNRNLTTMNEVLEQRVAERTSEVTAAHQKLTVQYDALRAAQGKLRYSGEVQAVLRAIAEAALNEASLDELYRTVHRQLERVLPAKNCNIALLDESRGLIVVPYCADESGTINSSRPVGGGMTEYVMRQGHTLAVTFEEWKKLQETGEITLRFAPVQNYLGAPLVDSGGKVFGVLSINVMGWEYSFQEHDGDVLSTIAAQVSLAIERKKAQELLAESEARFRQAMESSEVGLVDIDLVCQTVLMSPRWKDLLDLAAEPDGTLRWETYLANVHPEDLPRKKESLMSHLAGNKPWHEAEYRARRRDGSWTWVLSRSKALLDAEKKPVRLIGTISDITDLKEREAREKFRAEHDEMTGLYNRQGFLARVEEYRRQGLYGALMLIDLDDFEMINAVYGHATGDEYLQAFARHLRASFSQAAVVGRSGGDEFILFFVGCPEWKEANEAFSSMTALYLATQSGTYLAQMSAGISLCVDSGQPLELLIRQADLALSHAKKQGKCCCRVFEPFMQELFSRRQRIREELDQAIGRREFHLVYQPIFDIREEPKTVIAYEALLRWRSPTLGDVSPAEFIPVAESTNLILEIGSWVLAEACRFTTAYYSIHGRYATVSVNVSVRQLTHPGIVDEIRRILEQAQVPAEAISLEITESLLMTDVERCVPCLTALHDLGMGILLDDFGTGYSSFTYLPKLPITLLKIDKSLVDGLADQATQQSSLLIDSMIFMANLLGYGIVAEGVEKPEQLARLKAKDCPHCQGFLLGRPVPAEEILAQGLRDA